MRGQLLVDIPDAALRQGSTSQGDLQHRQLHQYSMQERLITTKPANHEHIITAAFAIFALQSE